MTEEATTQGIAKGVTNYGDRAFSLYMRRSFAKSMGYSTQLLSKPVVGIASSPSGYNSCHRAMPELVEAVKRGVLAAGALPIDFPTISLGEVYLNPTSLMIDKNFLFQGGSNMGAIFACQWIFCIVLHRKPGAGDAI